VNLPIHENACDQRGVVGRLPRKCPHWFGIDAHVDDDEEIARECEGTGCRVIVIRSEEVDFEARVRDGLGAFNLPLPSLNEEVQGLIDKPEVE
jgi:hypothetical protein